MAPGCSPHIRLAQRLVALLTAFLVTLALPFPLHAMANARKPPAAPPVVVEMLRLSVPEAMQAAWVEAEQNVWQPWLEQQDGFLRKDLLWDPQREEGQVLIHWHRQTRQAIPSEDVDAVQARFVAAVNQATGQTSADPLPLLLSAEWPLLASTTGSEAPPLDAHRP